MIQLTQQEFDDLFKEYPKVRKNEGGAPLCPYCANPLSPKNLEYYNGATEVGTPYCSIEIECDVCGKEIWRGGSWTEINDSEDLLGAIGDVLEKE